MMSRKNIKDLPLPPARYRVDLLNNQSDSEGGFETQQACREEDARRADSLEEVITNYPGFRREMGPLSLLERLDENIELGPCWPTMASSIFMRDFRIKATGHLWMLMDGSDQCTTGTILPRPWEFTPDELMACDPRNLLSAVRTALYKAGMADAKGWLFAHLHGEFDPEAKLFRLHLHCACDQATLLVLDRMRELPNYRFMDQLPDGRVPPVRTPIRINRRPLDNMPAPVTYLVQSFWPSRPVIYDKWGNRRRVRQKGAIPEPYASGVLVWLDRWQPKDLTLMIGLRVTREGLIRTAR